MKYATFVCVALATAGCSQPAGPAKPEAKKGGTAAKADAHDHGSGPHGGVVFDLGKHHAEFTVDHPNQEVTVYVLDEDAKKPVPVAADKLDLTIKSPAFVVEMKPLPMDGEPAGKSSRFVAKHEKFGKEQEFAGTVTGMIDGKPSQGEFKEEPEPKK